MWTYNHTDELYHFGVKGMKWGVRRYQNPDGSLTPAGKKRAIKQEAKEYRKELYREHNFSRKLARQESREWAKDRMKEVNNKDKKRLSDKQKKVLKFVSAQIAGLTISYVGAKIASNPKVRGVTGRILDKVGSKKIKDIDDLIADSLNNADIFE